MKTLFEQINEKRNEIETKNVKSQLDSVYEQSIELEKAIAGCKKISILGSIYEAAEGLRSCYISYYKENQETIKSLVKNEIYYDSVVAKINTYLNVNINAL